jgi:hypothetical protein
MYDTQLSFYLKNFYIKDFILENFKDEVLGLFSNKDPLYYFNISYNYNIYLFEPDGKVLCKLPFKLYSIHDKEDIIEDSYNMIFECLSEYLAKFSEGDYPLYIGLYIGMINTSELDILSLWFQRDRCINNIKKMQNDLSLPISIYKKNN